MTGTGLTVRCEKWPSGTRNEVGAVASADEPSAPTEEIFLGSRPRRLTGIDVARGVAVLGMYGAHIGPNPFEGWLGEVFGLFEGRSAALFAVLAGVSIALMSGGRNPKRGSDSARVALRLASRAPLLLLFGLLLNALNTSYLVILPYYGACFLLVIPLLRLRQRALAAMVGVGAVVLPLVSFVVRADLAPRDLWTVWPDFRFELFADGAGLGEVLFVLLISGTFPALTLMVYLFAGMAIGRLDLSSGVVCTRLVTWGSALAVAAYGTSWLAMQVLGGQEAVERAVEPLATAEGMEAAEFFARNASHIHGTPPTTTWAYELVSVSHASTPFDLLGCVGVAAAVIGGCQLIAARFPRAVRPLADLGSVILSAYMLHFVAIWLIWGPVPSFGIVNVLWFSIVAIVGAVAWKRWIGRGPFEWLLHVVSKWPMSIGR